MTAQRNHPAFSENILLAIAPAVFMGSDSLFEQLERIILTPDNLFDNMAPPGADGSFLASSSFEQSSSQFPLPSFYDFLTLTLSHLPYLGPQYLVALPHRFPLGPLLDKNSKKKYHLLPFQQQLAERFLTPQATVNEFLIVLLAGIIIRALTAIDTQSIINPTDRAPIVAWRQQAVDQLRPLVCRRLRPRWFGRGDQLYHLTALHQQFARINLDVYDRAEQSSRPTSTGKKIKNILRHELPGKFWLQNKKIHYHLLELQTLPARLSLPLPSPFLTMINLASLTHWLINGTIDKPEDIVQEAITSWRQELTNALDKKNQTRLYDHYPVCDEVLEKIDSQLKSVRPLGIKLFKSPVKNSPPRGGNVRPLALRDSYFLLSMVGQNNRTHKPRGLFASLGRAPLLLLPWQKSSLGASAGVSTTKANLHNARQHLIMTFDVMFKKKYFIESGAWLAPEPNKKKSLPLLAHLPKIGQKKHQPSHYYTDNSLQLLGGGSVPQKKLTDSMAWHYVSCQKILLPTGDMLRSKKQLNLGRHHGDKTIVIERQFFMPHDKLTNGGNHDGEKKPRVYVKALEKIIAPGGIDFLLLLPLSPTIKAFGKSDSHIRELEQHWAGAIKQPSQDALGGVVIEPLIPSENQKDSLVNKMESLQEIFLQSPDKLGGRLVARGATLSLTKGVFLNNFMEEPCQVIMLSGQTMPGETIINWVLELIA